MLQLAIRPRREQVAWRSQARSLDLIGEQVQLVFFLDLANCRTRSKCTTHVTNGYGDRKIQEKHCKAVEDVYPYRAGKRAFDLVRYRRQLDFRGLIVSIDGGDKRHILQGR